MEYLLEQKANTVDNISIALIGMQVESKGSTITTDTTSKPPVHIQAQDIQILQWTQKIGCLPSPLACVSGKVSLCIN